MTFKEKVFLRVFATLYASQSWYYKSDYVPHTKFQPFVFMYSLLHLERHFLNLESHTLSVYGCEPNT